MHRHANATWSWRVTPTCDTADRNGNERPIAVAKTPADAKAITPDAPSPPRAVELTLLAWKAMNQSRRLVGAACFFPKRGGRDNLMASAILRRRCAARPASRLSQLSELTPLDDPYSNSADGRADDPAHLRGSLMDAPQEIEIPAELVVRSSTRPAEA
jgi:hypothetical protein